MTATTTGLGPVDLKPTMTNLAPGGLVYIAWADSVETCKVSRIRIQDVHETDNGWLIADACNRTLMIRLAVSPSDSCLLVDQPDEDIENGRVGDVSVHPIFAISHDTKHLHWWAQRNLIEMGYTPTAALDLTVLRLGIFAVDNYASLREISEQDLRERIDEIVAELVEAAQCTADSLDLDTIQPDWATDDSTSNGTQPDM